MTDLIEITKFCQTDSSKGRVIALGFFDGVHLGHRKIISKTVEIAKKMELTSTVLTFENFKLKDDSVLTDINERKELFRKLGVDQVVSIDFEDVREVSARSFIKDLLLSSLNAKVLVAGTDYTFGKGAEGNIDLLKESSCPDSFILEVVPDVIVDGQKCSSSLIRKLLLEGKTDKANILLGDERFSYSGTIVKGKMLGRTLGFPTANLPVSPDKFKAKFGVYMTLTTIEGRRYKSVSNLGLRPTVEDSDNVNIETYIYGLEDLGNEELYGKDIKVELMSFIREEKRFASVEDLRLQVESDKEKVANLWEMYNI